MVFKNLRHDSYRLRVANMFRNIFLKEIYVKYYYTKKHHTSLKEMCLIHSFKGQAKSTE